VHRLDTRDERGLSGVAAYGGSRQGREQVNKFTAKYGVLCMSCGGYLAVGGHKLRPLRNSERGTSVQPIVGGLWVLGCRVYSVRRYYVLRNGFVPDQHHVQYSVD